MLVNEFESPSGARRKLRSRLARSVTNSWRRLSSERRAEEQQRSSEPRSQLGDPPSSNIG